MADKLELLVELQNKFGKTLDEYQAETNKAKKSSDKFSKSLLNQDKANTKVSNSLKVNKKSLAAYSAVGVYALKKTIDLVSSRNEEIDTLYNQSKAYDVSIEKLSAYNYVAELSKTSSETIAQTFKKLSMELGTVDLAGDGAVNKFKELGIATTDSNGKLLDMDTIFLNSIDRLNEFEKGSERSSKASILFGKRSEELASLIEAGSESIRGQIKDAKDLGNVYTNEMAKSAEAYNDNVLALQTSFKGLSTEAVNGLTPALTSLATTVTESVVIWHNWLDSIQDVFKEISGYGEVGKDLEDAEKGVLPMVDAWVKLENRIQKAYEAQSQATEGTKEYIEATTALNDAQLAQNKVYENSIEMFGVGKERIVEMGDARLDYLAKETEAQEELNKKTEASLNKNVSVNTINKVSSSGGSDDVTAGSEADIALQAYQKRVEAHQEYYASKRVAEIESNNQTIELALSESARIKEIQQEMAYNKLSSEEQEIANLEEKYNKEKELFEKHEKDTYELSKQYEKKKSAINLKYAEQEQSTSKESKAAISDGYLALGDTMANVFSTASSNNVKLAKVSKAVGLLNAGVSTGVGVAKALEGPYPLNLINAGVVAAAGGIQVASIASKPIPQAESFASGGIVKGASYAGDTVPANLNSNEAVFTADSYKNVITMLDKFANNESSGNTNVIYIQDNYGTKESDIARMTVTGIERANKRQQPNRIL